MVWGAWVDRPCRKLLVLSGVALGLALATKFSTLVLLPVLPALLAVRRWQEGRSFRPWETAKPLAAVFAIACTVVFAVYGFDTRPMGDSGILRRLLPAGSALLSVPAPLLTYFRGLADIGLKQTDAGLSTAWLLGEYSRLGWWYMAPVALAVKTPLAELGLFLLAGILAAARLRRTRLRAAGARRRGGAQPRLRGRDQRDPAGA
jgi:hypothetical protein